MSTLIDSNKTRRPGFPLFFNFPGPSNEDERRRQLFILICIPGIMVLVGFGALNIAQGQRLGGWLDIGVALLLGLSTVCLHRFNRVARFYRLNALVLAALMMFWFLQGGPSGEKILWPLAYPMIVLFTLGRVEGLIWSGVFILSLLFAMSLDQRIPIYAYNDDLKLRFVFTYLVIGLLAFGYELSRAISHKYYILEQAKLREETSKLEKASHCLEQANKALKKSEALFKHAQSIAHLGNWEYDFSTEKLWCSEEIFTIFGVKPETPFVEVARLAEVIPEFSQIREKVTRAMEKNRQLDIEFAAQRRSDGKIIFLHTRAELIRGQNRGTSRLTGVVQDITARKAYECEKKDLEEKLARSQKMEALGLLAGGVAHDLNNVMLGIVSYPDYLLSKMGADDPYHKPLKTICEAGRKAAAIVEDLLTLARRGVTTTQVLDLNAVIEEYLASPEFEKLKTHHPGVVFNAELSDCLILVKGSPVHLKKTVMNLVSNAAEAIQQNGIVRISTINCYVDRPIKGYSDVTEGDYVLLRIEDNGSGISPKDLSHIFEPFYTKKIMGRSGTGLGMAVVWGAVQDHHGYIDVKSRPGEGTQIDVYLPITRETRFETKSEHPVQDYLGHGETILIVDDVAEQRRVAGQMLSDLGYKVETAESGEAAVAHVSEKQVDLLVLDMIMDPGIDGLETYERILKINPRQKAVIVSGFSETDRVRSAQRLGAGAYLKKPYLLESLGMAVRTELDNPSKA